MMSKPATQRSVVTIVLVTSAICVGCGSQGIDEEQELSQGVVGTVFLKPGFDGEDAQLYFDPPDQTPRPLAGAMVYLMRYFPDSLNCRDIIVTTQSDSLGRFELRARPGTYYLAAGTTAVVTLVRCYALGDTVGSDFPINVLEVTRIHSGKFTEQSLELAEFAPQ